MKRTLNWGNPQALSSWGRSSSTEFPLLPQTDPNANKPHFHRERKLIVRLCVWRAASKSRVKARENVEVEVKCSGLTHERVYKFLSTIRPSTKGRTRRFMLIESGLQWDAVWSNRVLLSMHSAHLLSLMWLALNAENMENFISNIQVKGLQIKLFE